MKSLFFLLSGALCFTTLGCAHDEVLKLKESSVPQTETAPQTASISTVTEEAVILSQEPTMIDGSALDRSTSPCTDFYQFACGGWLAKTELPADQSRWTRSFSVLDEENLKSLRGILENYSQGKAASPSSPYAEKLGSFYRACMDEASAETLSVETLHRELAAIEKLRSKKELAKLIAHLHSSGAQAFFGFASTRDYKDSSQMIAVLDRAELGLPDREYYLSNEERMKQIRLEYHAYLKKLFELSASFFSGHTDENAAAVIRFETQLAEASLPLVERREPAKIYHFMDLKALMNSASSFAWKQYFEETKAPKFLKLNVAEPRFFTEFAKAFKGSSLEVLKTYLASTLLRSTSTHLGKKFVEASFHFNGQVLSGQKEDAPRWKRCVRSASYRLSEALGQAYVKLAFSSEAKTQSLQILKEIQTAFEANLSSLDWMDSVTKAQAIKKLQAIVNKIGYPDKWKTYDGLALDPKNDLENTFKISSFETARELAKIGKPVDRSEWEMPPQMVNAYYEPTLNEIVFPAAILQPPFFSVRAPLAANFGAIGMVIGHELTHGFDDEGSQFDEKGNLSNWWSDQTSQVFAKRTECLANQYDQYTVSGGIHLNGRLTLGENIADLGGMKLAYHALQASKASRGSGQKILGFTEEQQLFISHAQAWCTKIAPEEEQLRAKKDPHSPARYRVNGVLVNIPKFAEAFSCKEGSPMAPRDRCQVW
jgi:predicted metalloendopeptidase